MWYWRATLLTLQGTQRGQSSAGRRLEKAEGDFMFLQRDICEEWKPGFKLDRSLLLRHAVPSNPPVTCPARLGSNFTHSLVFLPKFQMRARQTKFKIPDDLQQWELSSKNHTLFFFNDTYFFESPEVYEGLLLVSFLRNVISHSGNVRWQSYSASPHFNSEQYSVIIKQNSFIIRFLFALRLCYAIFFCFFFKSLVSLI